MSRATFKNEENIRIFKNIFEVTPNCDLAEIFEVDINTITRVAKRLNLKKDPDFRSDYMKWFNSVKWPERKNNPLLTNGFSKVHPFSDSDNKRLFIELYPYLGAKQLEELFGLTRKQVIYYAKSFGIFNTRDADFRKKLAEYNAKVKKENFDKTRDESSYYFHESNWNDKLLNYITDKNQLENLKSKKIYNMKTNPLGMVRDHIYSRHDGYVNRVFPVILRHPANMQLITFSENNIKKMRSAICLEKLFYNIENFSMVWKEQEKCLKSIKEYRAGGRWQYQIDKDKVRHSSKYKINYKKREYINA